jgi:hypothetical protein
MTSIKFDCPACGQTLEAPLEMAGDTIECPLETCQQPIRVPGIPAQPPPAPTPPVRPTLKRQTAKAEAENTSFVIDSVSIRTEPIHDKKNKVAGWHITANGNDLLTLTKQKKRENALFMGKIEKHTVTAWFESGGGSFDLVPTSQWGIGMLVDGKPVESTLADPEIAGGQGRAGVWVFACFLAIKAAFQPAMALSRHDAATAAGQLFLYGIPALALICFGIMYKKARKAALITALVVGILESLDFIAGGAMQMVAETTGGNAGNSGVSLLIWGGLRIAALVWIIKGLRASKPGTVLFAAQTS